MIANKFIASPGKVLRLALGVLLAAGTITVMRPAPVLAATYSLWSNTAKPSTPAINDSSPIEVAVRITPTQSGFINAIKFYKGTGNGGTHTGSVWSTSGKRLATVTFTGETATGWQTANLPTPLRVTTGTTYLVSYYAPRGHVALDYSYFTKARASGPLTAPANTASAPNGMHKTGSSGFPIYASSAVNYWVDVIFTPDAPSTYYVATTGSDSANGSSATPWRTITKAVSTASAGSTIKIRSGSYTPFTITKALTVTADTGASVTILGASGVRDVVLISASNVTLSGMTVTGCVPNPNPPGSFEDNASSGVRVDDNTTGVVVTGMTIRDSHGINSEGLPFGCLGIMAHNANFTTLDHNQIYRNGYGIFVVGGGQNDSIHDNTIYSNDVLVRNTNAADDDFGAVGIGLNYITANPGPLVQYNSLIGNFGQSHDYGQDGGGLEIYAASNVTMDGNTISDNVNILETGTETGYQCANNKFTNNTGVGRGTYSQPFPSVGLLLRCNQNMLIDHNTLGPVDHWMFDITQGNFGGSIDGLTITNNTITQASDKVYAMEVNPSGYGFTINNNHYHYTGNFASDWNNNTIPSLESWKTLTGFDLASTTF